MPAAPLPDNEVERLASLHALKVLDTSPNPHFDAIVRVAAHSLHVSNAFIAFVDKDRLWFKAAVGSSFVTGSEIPRGHSFCAHAILDPGHPMLVEDTKEDHRLADNPLVAAEGGLRFYAGVPLLDDAGNALGAFCITDTVPRKLAAEEISTLCDLASAATAILRLKSHVLQLRESVEDNRAMIELSPHYPWTADPAGQILTVNWGIAERVGIAEKNLLGDGWVDSVHPDDLPEFVSRWQYALSSGIPLDCEIRMRDRQGDFDWWRIYAAPRRDASGKIIRWYGMSEDITERRKTQARIDHLVKHDPLTSLINQARFRDLVEEQVLHTARTLRPFALLCIDLDNFKAINDTLGHQAGDALLKQIAIRLQACLLDTDVLARFGSDEFLVLQTDLGQPEGAAALSQSLIEAVSLPMQIDGKELNLGVSIGIAFCPLDGTSPDKLLQNADLALYRAKEAGRATYRFFEAAMDEKIRMRFELGLEMKKGIANKEFSLAYQPLVGVRSRQVEGFEVLLRWQHPTRGLVSPADFIPAAEKNGLIIPLGKWVLEQACQDAASWPLGLRVAVNVSPVQFRENDLSKIVAAALAASGLPATRLELEITESVLLLDDLGPVPMLHALHALGVRIAMDDFGTGYSSLSYLQRFPFDKLKIDRSLITRMSEAADGHIIVRAVVSMCRALGIAITAEGVETKEQLEQLEVEGCDQAQGYYFSRPVPADKVPELIARLRGMHHPAMAENAPLDGVMWT